ncbi:MAG: FtsW/RodA/SpoVE family cell cycle protein [Trueperaceae bacterium]
MDRRLLTIQIMLGVLGVVGVATAAPGSSLEQLFRVLTALLITFFVARLNERTVVKLSPFVFVFLVAMLILVFIKGESPTGSDSKRWLIIFGVSFQPSEFMKVSVIAYLAAFFHNHLGNWHIWRPMVVIGIAAALVVVQPDVSTAAFIFLLALAIMVAAGATLVRILSISLAAALVAGLVVMPFLGEYQYWGNRIAGFFDMWGAQEQTADLSYQASVAETAVQRGGLIGIGAGRPVRVPEADTDFIAVALHQALGFIGIASLLLLYGLLAVEGLRIARSVTGPATLLAAGATTYVVAQAGLNLLVASGMAPVTGIPLPGVSYGLNSMFSVAIAFGFLHLAARQGRMQALGAEPAAGAR